MNNQPEENKYEEASQEIQDALNGSVEEFLSSNRAENQEAIRATVKEGLDEGFAWCQWYKKCYYCYNYNNGRWYLIRCVA
jgi:hypothetical protein